MSKLRQFFQRLGWSKPKSPETPKPPKSFWEELKAELRKRLVGYSATFIFGAVGLIFFLMGGYIVYDWIQDTKDRQRNFHEVCIDGKVTDAFTDDGIEGAAIYIEGNPEWTDSSNTSGYFRICITIPKAQRNVNLTIEKEGYLRQYFNKVSVPDSDITRENVQPFYIKDVKNAQSEPFLN